jgi:hypothetical protein
VDNFIQFQGNLADVLQLDERRLEIARQLLDVETQIQGKRIASLDTIKEFNQEFKNLNTVTDRGGYLPSIYHFFENASTNSRFRAQNSKKSGGGSGGGGKGGSKNNGSKKSPSHENIYEDEKAAIDKEVDEQLEYYRKNALAIFSEIAELEKRISADAETSLKLQISKTNDLRKAREAYENKQLAGIEQYRKALAEVQVMEQRGHDATLLDIANRKKLNQLEQKSKRLDLEQDLGIETSTDTTTLTTLNAVDYAAEKERDYYELLADYKEERELALAKAIHEAKMANNGEISELERATILKNINEKYDLEGEYFKKFEKDRLEQQIENDKKAAIEKLENNKKALRDGSIVKAVKEMRKEDKDTGSHNMANAIIGAVGDAIADLAKQLEDQIDKIASYQGEIDTRLQGSSMEQSLGSYWKQISKDMMSIGLVNPFFRQEQFAENIKSLVDMGIAFDLEQRAFLMTIKDKIATTFNAADGTLLRLIRIQQQDSTAGRLGMESALNAFLNSMYENTEYLKQVADGVRASLVEMEALMGGAEAAEIEYQVQKWMGSLYSVGMSDNAVSSIAQAIGLVGSGQLEGITGGGAGNLVIMAASNAGLSIADILTNGLTSEDTNDLLNAIVEYLAKLAKDSSDNKVVQQQLANVFGVKASDLKAATNLVIPGSLSAIAGHNLSYGNMIAQLNEMVGSMHTRTSLAEMMTNVWENGKYSLASSVASNPVSYLIYKMASLLDSAVGGIDLPFVNVMGFGVDLNTTVADLMRVASLSTGIIGSLPSMIQGLSNSFSGQRMLQQLGIGSGSGLAVTPRGTGVTSVSVSGGEVSESAYIGNASSSDIKEATIQESKDTKKQEMIEAQEENEHTELDTLNETTLKIYELIHDVVQGKDTFKVKVVDYGLTTNGRSSGSGSANGGTDGVARLAARAMSAGGGYQGDLNTHTAGDLGGWQSTTF